jgi:hypothetical protein
LAPGCHGSDAQIAMISGACPVSVKMEQIGNRTVDGDEALTLTRRLEPDHASLPSSRSQMRILCPVVRRL